MDQHKDQSQWEPVKEIMAGAKPVRLGHMHTYHARNTPRRLLYTTSYYKFASKMIGKPARVLDVGCGEGIGTWLLATECGSAFGVDFDKDSIDVAKENWQDPRIGFSCDDFIKLTAKPYDAIVSLDVIEHILPENADAFLRGITDNLTPHGIAVIGTPNITSKPYASAVTNAGHVNMYTWERLEAEMSRYFTQVFMFGANDEIVHTGFAPMVHYLLAVGVRKRT